MEWLLGMCTVLGGISAVWFFWDKISSRIFRSTAGNRGLSAQDNITHYEPGSLNDRYRVRLLGAVGKVRLFGNDKSRALDSVFVRLSIADDYKGPTSDPQLMGLMDAGLRRRFSLFVQAHREMSDLLSFGEEGRSRRTITPDDLLRAGRQAVVTGAPGCGKTTLLKYLAQQTLLKGADRWAVFIELKTIRTQDLDETPSLPELLFTKAVAEPLGLTGPERQSFHAEFLSQLRAGKVSLYLDGLDEVRHQSLFGDLCSAISEFAEHDQFKHNTLIISTRPFGLHRASLGDLQQMEIQPLDTKQIETFLRNYYPDDEATRRLSRELRKPGALRDLARVPVTLAAIIELYRDKDTPDLSAGRLDIYEKIVRRLVAKLDQEKNVRYSFFRLDDHEGTLKLDFLEQIAFERLLLDENTSDTEASRFIFDSEDILAKAKAFVRSEDLQTVSPYTLADDVKATPLLREVSENSFAFAHSTIQEYLAAKRLAQHRDCERIFCRAYFNAAQVAQEVLPMTLGLVREADYLYEALEHLPESLTFTNFRLRVRGLCYAARISQQKFTKLFDYIVRVLVKSSNQDEESYRRVFLNDLWFLTETAREYLEEKLIPFLADGTGFRKEKAAEALTVIGSEKSFIPLVKALDPRADGLLITSLIGSYEDSLVRYVCRALVRINPQKAVQVLASIQTSYSYGDVDRLLKQVGTEEAFRVLLARRKGMDWGSSRAIKDLLEQSETRGVIGVLVEALHHPSDSVRGVAVETLGIIGSEDAVSQIAECLSDPHFTVRWKAANALGYIRSEEAIEPLLRALATGEDSTVRWNAAMALRDIPSEIAVAGLVDALKDPDAEVRYHAATALGQVGSERAVEPLIRFLKGGGDAKSRSAAAYALYSIRSKKALASLIECVTDPDPQVRSGVAYALGNTRSEEAIVPLVGLLADESVEVREAAVTALGLTGLKTAVPYLLRVVKADSNGRVRETTLRALGDIDSPEVVEPLLADLAISPLAHYAAESLAQISISSVALALPNLLKHESKFLRKKTAEIIGYYCADQAILNELLRLAESDPDGKVREVATEAANKYARRLELLGTPRPLAENDSTEPDRDSQDSSRNISYVLNIKGNNYGNIQQGGQDNTQTSNEIRTPVGRSLAELLDAYDVYLRARVGKVRILGEAHERELKDVFVELSVVSQHTPRQHADFLSMMDPAVRGRFNTIMDTSGAPATDLAEQHDGKNKHRVRVDELLRRRTKAIVAGAPGCGKTTLLKYLALQAHDREKWLVVWLELKVIDQLIFTQAEEAATRDGNLVLQQLWLRNLKVQLSLNDNEVEVLAAYWRERLRVNEIAVLLDGFDELQDEALERNLNKCIRDFASASQASTILISTRPYAQRRLGNERLQELEIEPLDQEQIEAFLNCYYPDDAAAKSLLTTLRESSSLRELLHVPLLLGVILRLYRENRFTNDRLKLYETIIADLIHELDRSKSVIRQFKIRDERLRSDFLEFLAFDRLLLYQLGEGEHESSRIVFSYGLLREKAGKFLAQERLSEDPRALVEDVLATPLLREVGTDAFAFTHLTLQEYLAARAFAAFYRVNELEGQRTFCRMYHNPVIVVLEVIPMMLGAAVSADKLYDEIKNFSEALDFVGLRLRLRGLAYRPNITRPTLVGLMDEVEEMLVERRTADATYCDLVANSLHGISGDAEGYVIERISRLLQNKNNVARWRAARALGQTRSLNALEPLMDSLGDPLEIVRANAAEALGRIGSERAVPPLLNALKDEVPIVRANAAKALGIINSQDAVEPLIQVLTIEEDDYARGIIADSLGDLGDERAIDVLVLEAKRNKEGGWHASEALVKIGERGITEVLRCIVGEDNKFRWDAFTSLPDNLPPTALDALGDIELEGHLLAYTPYSFLVDTAEQDAIQELLVLAKKRLVGQMTDREATSRMQESLTLVPAALKALKHPDSQVRENAADVLGIIEDRRAIGPLIEALRDKDSTVREKAAEALGQIKSPLACRALAESLSDESDIVRQRAATVVGTLCRDKSDIVVDSLADLAIKEPNHFIRWNSITSLGKVGGEKAAFALLYVLLFNRLTVDRERAAEALSTLRQSDLKMALVTALYCESEGLRSKAAQIIGYYSTEMDILHKLKVQASEDENTAVRDIARESAERLFRKLQLLA